MVEVLNSPKKFKIRCPYCLLEVSFTEEDIEYHPSDFKYLKDDFIWCKCGRQHFSINWKNDIMDILSITWNK